MPRVKKAKEWCVTLHDSAGCFAATVLLSVEDEFGIPCTAFFTNQFDFTSTELKFFVGQLEQTTTGIVHLQGYVEFMKDVSFVDCKRLLKPLFRDSTDRSHIEVAHGTRAENVAYCSKDDTRLTGSIRPQLTWSRAGTCDETKYKQKKKEKRPAYEVTDKVYAMLETKTANDCMVDARNEMKVATAEDEKDFWHRVLRRLEGSHASLDQFTMATRAAAKRQRNEIVKRNVQVRVLFGPPGRGKTHRVFQEYGLSLYKKEKESKWWCGYNGQKTLLLDDLLGEVGPKAYLTPSKLQEICDGWEMSLEAKHKRTDAVMADWNVVVITTNLLFDDWFHYWEGVNPQTKASILSRIPPSCWETIDDGIDHRRQIHIRRPTNIVNIVEE